MSAYNFRKSQLRESNYTNNVLSHILKSNKKRFNFISFERMTYNNHFLRFGFSIDFDDGENFVVTKFLFICEYEPDDYDDDFYGALVIGEDETFNIQDYKYVQDALSNAINYIDDIDIDELSKEIDYENDYGFFKKLNEE